MARGNDQLNTNEDAYKPAEFCPHCGYAMDPGACPECGEFTSGSALWSMPDGVWQVRKRGIQLGLLVIVVGGGVVVFCLALILGLINIGLPIGYWGEFNRARALL